MNKVAILVSLLFAAAAANTYSSYNAPAHQPEVVRIAFSSGDLRSSSYAPAVRAPVQSYSPAVVRAPAYAPAVRAPVQSYGPAIRDSAYAPAVRAVHFEPVSISFRSEGPSYGSTRSSYGSYAQSAPAYGGNSDQIMRFQHDISRGQSTYNFDTSNGIRQEESTVVRGAAYGGYSSGYGNEAGGSSISKTGSYSYISPDGTPIQLSWIADEQGFRASGAHLPTPPPIPAEIQASLRGHNHYNSGSSYSMSSPNY